MRRTFLILAAATAAAALPQAAQAAVTTSLSAGTLTLSGDGAADQITLRAAGDTIQLEGGPAFDRSTFTRIEIRAGAGADGIRLDAAIAEPITVEGQSGIDTLRLTGTDDAEEFTLQAFNGRALITRDVGANRVDAAGVENAELSAAGGPDLIDVGDLDTTAITRLDVDPGDGIDAIFTAGTPGPDTIQASSAGTTLARVTGLPAELRIANPRPEDRLTIQAGGGADSVTAIGVVGARLALTLEGNDGPDTITGASQAEMLRGGPDADVLRGGQGADQLELGDGADTAIWTAVEGEDSISGDQGDDRVRVLGTSADDDVELSSSGVRSGVAQLSLETVEIAEVAPAGGADKLRVRNGTPLKTVELNLPLDLKSDTIAIDGTPGDDSVKVNAAHVVSGLPATVKIAGAEPGDRLELDGGAGNDTIDASTMTKDKLQPFIHGGLGRDTLVGSPGQDVIDGGQDVDIALLRDGLDTFNWVAGDGNDIVEGGNGTDFLLMNGSGANEQFAVTPVGSRTRVTRDVSNVNLDLGQVERVNIMPADGADTVRVEDMSGTDTDHVELELAPVRGTTATDGARDSVLVNGTFGNDAINVTAAGHQVAVQGLAARVFINRSDPALDTLHIDTRPGNDLVSVLPSVHNLLTFTTS